LHSLELAIHLARGVLYQQLWTFTGAAREKSPGGIRRTAKGMLDGRIASDQFSAIKGPSGFSQSFCCGDFWVIFSYFVHESLGTLNSLFTNAHLPVSFTRNNVQHYLVPITVFLNHMTPEATIRINPELIRKTKILNPVFPKRFNKLIGSKVTSFPRKNNFSNTKTASLINEHQKLIGLLSLWVFPVPNIP